MFLGTFLRSFSQDILRECDPTMQFWKPLRLQPSFIRGGQCAHVKSVELSSSYLCFPFGLRCANFTARVCLRTCVLESHQHRSSQNDCLYSQQVFAERFLLTCTDCRGYHRLNLLSTFGSRVYVSASTYARSPLHMLDPFRGICSAGVAVRPAWM